MKWIVTGATGAVVSEIVMRLLAAGDQVTVIKRGDDIIAATERVYGFLAMHPNLRVILGKDIREENCGLSPERVFVLETQGFDGFIHGAAELAYDGQATIDTNLIGTQNALTLAHRLGVKDFVLLSTAYVAGSQQRFLETDVGDLGRAQNDYERSKISAEALVRGQWPNPVIFRISIMVGDSKTGAIRGFNGYYSFIGSVAANRRLALKHYRNTPFYLGVDPITGVGIKPDSTLNLVPNDWGTDRMLDVLNDLRPGRSTARALGTFHITHTDPVDLGWLFRISFKLLDVPVTCDPPVPTGQEKDWQAITRRMRARSVDLFGHYVQVPYDFGRHENLSQVPGYVPPPKIDTRVVKTLIDYAVGKNFGQPATKAAPAVPRVAAE